MKKLFLLPVLSVAMLLSTATMSYAAQPEDNASYFYLNEDGEAITSVDEYSELLPEGISEASSDDVNGGISTYSSIFALAEVSISNEGNGVIGVYADTLTHVPVKEIRMGVYLDRWNEEQSNWDYVRYDEFDEIDEDYPNGDMCSLIKSYTIIDIPTGYYYRLRGVHGIYTDKVFQARSTRTDGVMITND